MIELKPLLERFMSIIKSAISAISNSNMKALISCLDNMSKEELQELASKYVVTSATIHMAGSWVEESEANLIDFDGNVIQADVSYERGYKGAIEQYYTNDSLHFAALVAVNPNVTEDYDADYFTPGSMIFGEDYGHPADDASSNADCNFEERYIRREEIEDDVDLDECELEDSDSDTKLYNAFIQAIEIDLILNTKNKITLPLLDAGRNELWFIFSILFISSKKSIKDLGNGAFEVSEFMENNFGIIT